MSTARDVMQADAHRVEADDSVLHTAQLMRDARLGLIPVCDKGRLVGVVTSTDIVTRCVAEGHDPQTTPAGQLAKTTQATVDAGDSLEKALVVMAQYRVRRLPVIDGEALIGVLSQGDVTRSLVL